MNPNKIYQINEKNESIKDFYVKSKSPPMNDRLCPWIEKKYTKTSHSHKIPKKKSKKVVKKKSEPYYKNLSIAQKYSIYPLQKPLFPTPLQFIFIGDEEFFNLQNDIFREDSNYLFPPNYERYIISKFFYKWKNKIIFPKKCIKQKNANKTKKEIIKSMHEPSSQESKLVIYRRKRWMNDDYEISPISMEYYSQKRLNPTKTSSRLFNSSLVQSRIGDFQNDRIWQKIINHY